MDSEENPAIKLFLWTLPRSLSTVLCRCLGAIDGVQIVFEPYRTAYHDGPDANKLGMPASYTSFRQQAKKLQMSFKNTFVEETCSFSWVKQMLEEDVSGDMSGDSESLIFAKDFAYCVHGRYDALPVGYRHAFLIRHPHRMLPSYKKMKLKQLKMSADSRYEDIPECLRPPQNGYQEMYELHQHLKDLSGVSPIIIDADDLQRHPGPILNQFCRSLGIPFTTDKHLIWTSGEEFITDWVMSEVTAKGNALQEGGFFSGALRSSGFQPPAEVPSKQMMSEDLHGVIDASMPFFDKLYLLRLGPFS